MAPTGEHSHTTTANDRHAPLLREVKSGPPKLGKERHLPAMSDKQSLCDVNVGVEGGFVRFRRPALLATYLLKRLCTSAHHIPGALKIYKKTRYRT